MKFNSDNVVVAVNSTTEIPLVELLDNALKWGMIVNARHILVTHSGSLEIKRIEATRYSFVWTCDYNGRQLMWIPRAATPPSENTIANIRDIPGFMLADLVRCFNDPATQIQSSEAAFSADNDVFGYVEIR